MDFLTHIEISAPHVRSLCWQDDRLVDWAGGGVVYRLDGSSERARVNYAYRFNAAVASPSGLFAVIFERCGTKGLLLKQGKIVREINRSFYYAHAYQYPVALFQLPDGREILAHCPEDYNRLELEDAETGERLTASSARKPRDCFHSRLAVSPDSKWLLSAGWVWHPWNVIALYDIESALRDPRTLDGFGREPAGSRNVCCAEVESAAFLDDSRVLISTSAEPVDADEDDECGELLQPDDLIVWDFRTSACRSVRSAGGPLGTTMPVGTSHVVAFSGQPRLYHLNSGRMIHSWPEIDSGKAHGCIVSDSPMAPIALDPAHNRFAVASGDAIHVIAIDLERLGDGTESLA